MVSGVPRPAGGARPTRRGAARARSERGGGTGRVGTAGVRRGRPHLPASRPDGRPRPPPSGRPGRPCRRYRAAGIAP